MKEITALDLRRKLGSILDEVSQGNEQIVVSRSNKPLAVLISVSDYEEKVLMKSREQRLRSLAERMEDWRKSHGAGASKIDVVKAVRETREGS